MIERSNSENQHDIEMLELALPQSKREKHYFEQLKKESSINCSMFPSTRFYGSKLKQTLWLHEHLKSLPGTTVLDAFGGTGTVSLLFSRLGRQVTYNDFFKFNEITARALRAAACNKLASYDLEAILRDIRPTSAFITRTFDGIFYPRAENRWLDGAMETVRRLNKIEQNVTLYCLFQACLKKRPFNLFHRPNLHLRNSQHQVSFGNRTTWNKPFSDHMRSAYDRLARLRLAPLAPIRVLKNGDATRLPIGYDVVYLDPPYIAAHRFTESYLQRYHFLEGLALYEQWPELIDPRSPTKQIRSEGELREWSPRIEFSEKLFELVAKHRRSTVVLSYVSNALPTEQQIVRFFRQEFGSVQVHRSAFRRVLSPRARTELLVIGEP